MSAPPEPRTVRANGLDVAYVEAGQGDPVLLLHGFPDVATTFAPVMERSPRRATAASPLGCAGTGRPATRSSTTREPWSPMRSPWSRRSIPRTTGRSSGTSGATGPPRGGRPGDHLDRVIETLRRPGVLVPTLLLLGERDGCVGPAMAEGGEGVFRDRYRVEVVPGWGHFLHLERPDDVAERILGWLRASR